MKTVARRLPTVRDQKVNRDRLLGHWQALSSKSHQSPLRETSLRVVADLISVNASMILAFVLWYFFLPISCLY